MPRWQEAPVIGEDGSPRWASAPALPAEERVRGGTILPYSVMRNEKGDERTVWDWPEMLRAAGRVATLPGEVYRGEVPMMQPSTQVVPTMKEGGAPGGFELREHITSPDLLARTTEAAATISPVNPAVRAGARAIPGMKPAGRKVPEIPTMQQLHDAGSEGYRAAKRMGVDYFPEAVKELSSSAQSALLEEGIIRRLAPTTHSVLRELASPPKAGVGERVIVPISSLIAARQSLQKARMDFTKPAERTAAERVIRALDQFMEVPDPATVVAGPARKAGRTLQAGRENKAAAHRSEALAGIGEGAELRAAAANSGQNLDNAIRSRVASLLLDRKKSAGFNAEELRTLERISRGGLGRNALRTVANAMGGGGGVGGSVIGGIAGSLSGSLPIGVGVPLIGFGLKKGAAGLTSRKLRLADELVRSRSPLAKEMARDAPYRAMSAEQRALLIRALLMSETSNGT